MPPPDDALAIFEAQRPRLLRLAYRMLGSHGEAEDIVQDAWLRWVRVTDPVDAPAAFLSRTVTRLCLDQLKSARVRRETYVGEWLPEPMMSPAPDSDDPGPDDLTLTLMMALERLSPLERAAFLLHDIFGVPFEEVATTIRRDAGAVRQLAVRARRHIEAARPRYSVGRAEGERIAQAFFAASKAGDVAALRTLLADDVVLHSDGGGRIHAFLNPIAGIDRMLRLYRGLARKFAHARMELLQPRWIDGLPGYVSHERGVFQTTAFEISDGRIATIYITRNPDKLTRVARELRS